MDASARYPHFDNRRVAVVTAQRIRRVRCLWRSLGLHPPKPRQRMRLLYEGVFGDRSGQVAAELGRSSNAFMADSPAREACLYPVRQRCRVYRHGGDQVAARTECWSGAYQARKALAERIVENFNDKLHNECLNREWFVPPREAQIAIEKWRQFYKNERPHSELGNRTSASAGRQRWQNQIA